MNVINFVIPRQRRAGARRIAVQFIWTANFLYPENPWLCQGFKEALAMSRKREPPML